MNTNTGSTQQQLFQLFQNLGGVVSTGMNSNTYSVQGWLAHINAVVSSGGGVGGGGLSNGDIITGPSGEQTQLFFQAATPTPDVANAIWLNTTTDLESIWNGTYWLGNTINWTAGRRASGSSSPNFTDATEWNYALGQQTFISVANYACTLASAGDASNYYNFTIRSHLQNANSTSLYTSTAKLFANGVNAVSSESVNVLVPVTIGGGSCCRALWYICCRRICPHYL